MYGSVTWAVAAALAFRSVLQNLALVKAVIAAVGIIAVAMLYTNLAVADDVAGFTWVLVAVFGVLFAALLALYPRGQKAS